MERFKYFEPIATPKTPEKMKCLLKKTLLSGIAVLTSMYLTFGGFKTVAQDFPKLSKQENITITMKMQTPPGLVRNVTIIDQKAQNPETKTFSELQENMTATETQEEYNLLQEYFRHKRFEGYEEKYEQLKEFKELEGLQEDLNKAYNAKNEKATEEAGIKVTRKEKDINKKFALNRTHTGIEGIRKDKSRLEKELNMLKQDLTKAKISLEKRGIPAYYFDCYINGKPLTLEKYSEIKKKVKENNLKHNTYLKFVRLEKILDYEDYIDKTANKFKVDKKEIIELWNQESELNIFAIGKHEERGLAQFRPITAQLIAKELSSDLDFKELDYSFEKLSSNYELNIIMTAAQIASTSNLFDYKLKEAKLTFNQFYELVKEKGKTCTFSRIKEARENPEASNLDPTWKSILKHYKINQTRIQQIHKIYEDRNGLLKDAIKYIIHNGGCYAINSVREDSFWSELLLYHLAIYVNNLTPLYKIVNLHYGDLYNLIQKNRYSLERLRTGESMILWGVNVSKHDITQLQKYATAGLLNKPLDERLKDSKVIVVAGNHLFDKDMNLRCELDPYHLLVLKTFKNLDKKYEQLKEFKELEGLQEDLNKAYNAKNEKATKEAEIKVTRKEKDINKRFSLNRLHTGINGVREDITKLEKGIINYGFKLDLEAYEQTKREDYHSFPV